MWSFSWQRDSWQWPMVTSSHDRGLLWVGSRCSLDWSWLWGCCFPLAHRESRWVTHRIVLLNEWKLLLSHSLLSLLVYYQSDQRNLLLLSPNVQNYQKIYLCSHYTELYSYQSRMYVSNIEEANTLTPSNTFQTCQEFDNHKRVWAMHSSTHNCN